MFVAEALADFSASTIALTLNQKQEQNNQKQSATFKILKQENQTSKRPRSDSQQKMYLSSQGSDIKKQEGRTKKELQNSNKHKSEVDKDQSEQTKYTQFKQGQKILVKETFQNGWWYGHCVGKPQTIGFFPSNYVKTGVQPPPPKKQEKNQKLEAFDPEENFNNKEDWINKEFQKIQKGPLQSDYYQGITGYKVVKIDEKNQNILKGNHVKYDVSTGLARVPIKDQAPAAKAIRQMGHYFDYHQWNEARNSQPQKKARPDPKKKKQKKLRLKMMD